MTQTQVLTKEFIHVTFLCKKMKKQLARALQ